MMDGILIALYERFYRLKESENVSEYREVLGFLKALGLLPNAVIYCLVRDHATRTAQQSPR